MGWLYPRETLFIAFLLIWGGGKIARKKIYVGVPTQVFFSYVGLFPDIDMYKDSP
jgi:hypothetical protein